MRLIRLVAFVSGLVVLGIEITAFRIVAPFFGNSIFITSNILAVILAGLAIGYWTGGRLADRTRAARPLFFLMLLTACVCALIPFVAPALLGGLRDQISTIDWRLIVFSLLGCVALFLLPFTLLGMVSPWLVHLGTDQHEHRGRAAGSIYAWSTVGSLLGTFLPTLLLVPLIGSKKTILLFCALLALMAVIGLARVKWAPVVAVLIVAAIVMPASYKAGAQNIIDERESAAEYLRVVHDRGDVVHLEQDEEYGVHSIHDPEHVATGLYFDWFGFAPELRPKTARAKKSLDVGIIGVAGGTIARQLETWFGPQGEQPHDLHIKGAELDPATIDLARKHFALDDLKTLDVQAADGRVWLGNQTKPFDVLLVDAFRQLYIPPHLTTKEFFELANDKLRDDGIFALNLNALGDNTLIERTLTQTVASVFPYVTKAHVAGSFNVLLFASRTPLPLAEPIDTSVVELQPIAKKYAAAVSMVRAVSSATDAKAGDIATDDRPLVESLYDFMVGRALLK